MSASRNLKPQKVMMPPLTPWDKAMEVFSAAGVATAVYLTFWAWAMLPESIPRHFGISGEITAWGGKSNLVILLIATILLYLGLTLGGRHPHLWSMPWKITAQNAKMQYQIARNMLVTAKAITVWIFTYMLWTAVNAALGKAEGLGAWFLPLSLGAIIGTIGVNLCRLNKHK